MITNSKVLQLSDPVEKAYQNAVDRLIVNIARHLKSGKAIHTAKWEVQKLSEMGQLTAENARIINDALKALPQDVRDALDATAKDSLKLVDEAIEEAIRTGTVERAPISSVQGVIEELSQQAIDQFNLVNTTMLESAQTAYLKVVNDTVMWENRLLSAEEEKATLETLNDATTALLTGGETRRLALRKAIKELNDKGLYGFVDKAGRHWSPEAYVNMCMRTTVHNVAVGSVKARQEDYGSSIFQCSYHPASRPDHYPFQNKFYDWNGDRGIFTDGAGVDHTYEPVGVTGYGTAAGLFGVNCGHLPLPQIPGVTIPTDPDMQDPEVDAQQYRESQEQRALERRIRMSKRLEDAYKAAGDDAGAEQAAQRTRLEQARMREFIDRTGRRRRYDREQIGGYGPDKLVRPKPAPAPKKRTKKTTPPATPTAPTREQMKVENFPDAFTKTAGEKKSTQALVDYVNGLPHDINPDIIRLYNSIGQQHGWAENQMPFKISHASDHMFSYRYSGITGKLVSTTLTIPKVSGKNDVGQVNITLHEMMHMMDMYLRTNGNGHDAYSAAGNTIVPRFDAAVKKPVTIGPKTKKLFDAFNQERDKLAAEREQKRKTALDALTLKYYPTGKVDVFASLTKYKQFTRERSKIDKEIIEEYDWKTRASLGGGVDGLQDIYDALSGGVFRDTGVVKYGHGSSYFRSVTSRKSEILANYGALCVTRPDLIDLLEEEQPELAGVLRDLVHDMAMKVN